MKSKLLIVASTFVALIVTAAGNTVENLNRAYQTESNAANRYRDFARQADSQNHQQTAKLFRAAAASEEIHRKMIARAIGRVGGRVETFQLDPVLSGSNVDHLNAAIRDELTESGSLFPGYLSAAKQANEKAAARALNYTLRSDKALAAIFQQALHTTETEVSAVYYVCQDCGLVVTQLPKKKCPVCHEKLDEFKIIH